ncbi:MAG: hypothetical protein R3D05_13010 [Dongiaceae bacterium]
MLTVDIIWRNPEQELAAQAQQEAVLTGELDRDNLDRLFQIAFLKLDQAPVCAVHSLLRRE